MSTTEQRAWVKTMAEDLDHFDLRDKDVAAIRALLADVERLEDGRDVAQAEYERATDEVVSLKTRLTNADALLDEADTLLDAAERRLAEKRQEAEAASWLAVEWEDRATVAVAVHAAAEKEVARWQTEAAYGLRELALAREQAQGYQGDAARYDRLAATALRECARLNALLDRAPHAEDCATKHGRFEPTQSLYGGRNAVRWIPDNGQCSCFLAERRKP